MICARHEAELRRAGILRLSLFGSVARGDAEAHSDIDLVAELDPEAGIGLFALEALERRLAELLGRKVDLLPEPVEKPRLRANIERDAGVPSKHDPADSLAYIIENAERVERYVVGMDCNALAGNGLTRDAVERCVERVCEAAHRLGGPAVELMPSQPWTSAGWATASGTPRTALTST